MSLKVFPQFLHANDIVFGETDIYEKGIKNKT